MLIRWLFRRRFSFIIKAFVLFFLFSSIFLLFKSRKKEDASYEMMYFRNDTPVTPEDRLYEEEISADEARIVPGLGDGGGEVLLEGEEKKKGQADLERIALNEYLSKQISLSRTLDGKSHI